MYKKKITCGFDSLMSVNKIQNFLWKNGRPINYDYKKNKWPRTQDLEPIFEINSAIFIANKDIYENLGNRIGNNPFLFENSKMQSFDIDWEEDFVLAQKLYRIAHG